MDCQAFKVILECLVAFALNHKEVCFYEDLSPLIKVALLVVGLQYIEENDIFYNFKPWNNNASNMNVSYYFWVQS